MKMRRRDKGEESLFKAKFLTTRRMLYQDLPQVREMIDKLDGQEITEPYIKIGLGDCRIALCPPVQVRRGVVK